EAKQHDSKEQVEPKSSRSGCLHPGAWRSICLVHCVGGEVVHEAPDFVASRQVRTRAYALDVLDDRRDRVFEGVHVLVEMVTARRADHFAQLSLIESAKSALCVMDHHHLASLHDRL